jgi:hypothetical protein
MASSDLKGSTTLAKMSLATLWPPQITRERAIERRFHPARPGFTGRPAANSSWKATIPLQLSPKIIAPKPVPRKNCVHFSETFAV